MFKMTPNVLRNLLTRKPTRRYPHEVRPPFANQRGELINEIEKCTFCSVCAVKCPSQCIHVNKKAAVWSCDPFACVFCGICAEACPAQCLHLNPAYRRPARERGVIRLQGESKK